MAELIGHKRVRAYFARALKEGFLSHAYLLSGREGIGKRCMAFSVIRDAHGGLEPGVSDPYTVVIEPDEKGSLSIETHIRPIRKALSLRPPGDMRLFVLIDRAEAMSGPAGQALLKILEEPPAYATFFLVSSSPGHLPETIRSRCTEIRCVPPADTEVSAYLASMNVSEKNRSLWVSLAGGSVGWLTDVLSSEKSKAVLSEALSLVDRSARPIGERVAWAGELAKDDAIRSRVLRWIYVARQDVVENQKVLRALLELYETLGRSQYQSRLALEHFMLSI